MQNKHVKTTIFSLVMIGSGIGFLSCGEDYDDTWVKETTADLEKRVTALEDWQKTVNSQISSLQTIISSLEENDCVTKVTPLANGTGYVISFKESGDVTILNGEKGEKGDTGDAPVISVKQDTDGKYYWTLNGEWLMSGSDKMPVTGEKGEKGDKGDTGATGEKGDKGDKGDAGTTGASGADAIAPQVQINKETNEWEISTDGGKTWSSTGIKATGEKGDKGDKGDTGATGEKGDKGDKGDTGATGEKGDKGDKGDTGAAGEKGEKGDSMFTKIDLSSSEYVALTLADGTTVIKLPYYSSSALRFSSYDEQTVKAGEEVTIPVYLPGNLTTSNYDCIMATVTPTNGVVTRSASNGWTVKINAPTFSSKGALSQNYVNATVLADASVETDETAMLSVYLMYKDGKQEAVSRLLRCTSDTPAVTTQNPAAYITDADKLTMLRSMKDVDGTGRLYEINYTADYKLDDVLKSNKTTTTDLFAYIGQLLYDKTSTTSSAPVKYGAGCSIFAVPETQSSHYIMGRNYDFKHATSDGKSYQYTAAILVHTSPKNGKKSISMVDGLNMGYGKGFYTDGTTDLSLMMGLPYAALDGINEDGFCIGVLALDGKQTNQPTGKNRISTTTAIRMLLDRASTVKEAIQLLGNYAMDMRKNGSSSYHYFMADATGDYAIVEYVTSGSSTTPTVMETLTGNDTLRCVTNFYLSPTMAGNAAGWWKSTHGKDRYQTLRTQLLSKKYKLSASEAMSLLGSVSQAPGEKITSQTQWSSLYDLTEKSLRIAILREYGKEFNFKVE